MKIRLTILGIIIVGIIGFYFYDINYVMNTVEMKSPDQLITVNFDVDSEKMTYSVEKEGEMILNHSALGIVFKDKPVLQENVKIVEVVETSVEDTWYPVLGDNSEIVSFYNEYEIKCVEIFGLKRNFSMIFRVFDDGVGFRYDFPEQNSMVDVEIMDELTSFSFSSNYDTWWIKNDFNSYEHLYQNSELKDIREVATPLTLITDSGVHVAVHEAQLTDYSSMALKKVSGQPFELEALLAPWPDGVKVKTKTPFKTPWRTITITDSAGELTESNLILNLNDKNVIDDTSWIQPMKYSSIWWELITQKKTWSTGVNHGATTENAYELIDFSSENNLQGVLVEGWNQGFEDETNNQNYLLATDDFNLEDVVSYANEKNISFIIHNETFGNILNYEQQLDESFRYYQSLGVKAVKIGYDSKDGIFSPIGYSHHSQYMIKHYNHVIELAGKYNLMVIFDQQIKGTGLNRTYPNFMTNVGLHGMDFNVTTDQNPPEFTTVLPFTRLLAGPIDYGAGIFNLDVEKLSHVYEIQSTKARQLALYVIMSTPLQIVPDQIDHYKNDSAFKFLKQIPTSWDKTTFLESKIGDYVSVVRQSGDEYFLAAISDENKRQLEIPLDFLDSSLEYEAVIYQDGNDTSYVFNNEEVNMQSVLVTAEDVINLNLPAGGGTAIHLKPTENTELQHYVKPVIKVTDVIFPEKVLSNDKIKFDVAFDYAGTLYADESIHVKVADKEQIIELRRNENGHDRFEFDSIFEPGVYDVYVNDVVKGNIEVKPRSSYVTESNYEVDFFDGGILQASVTLSNLGSEDASRKVRLKVNDVPVQEEVFTVPAKDGGNHITVNLRYLVKIKRTYKVEIGASPDLFVKYR
jgi:alpha-glucosidase